MAIETPLSAKAVQTTNTLLMISPDKFGFNDQTAGTNTFQKNTHMAAATIRDRALAEFNGVVDTLRNHEIEVVICPSKTDVQTPDAVFPNNWISFHREIKGVDVVLYPMLAPNRRAERQFERVKKLMPWIEINPERVLDLTGFENSGQFLEGTGSLVFDRSNKVVFAHESPRTSYNVLDVFCERTGYRAVKFHAFDNKEKPIYHTNVVMAIGAGFSVVCLESISDRRERINLEFRLKDLGLEVIDITLDQLHSFCGNVLETKSATGQSHILMSVTAYDAFTEQQRRRLMTPVGKLIPVNIETIENVGGGSARCMVAEVFPGKDS